MIEHKITTQRLGSMASIEIKCSCGFSEIATHNKYEKMPKVAEKAIFRHKFDTLLEVVGLSFSIKKLPTNYDRY